MRNGQLVQNYFLLTGQLVRIVGHSLFVYYKLTHLT